MVYTNKPAFYEESSQVLCDLCIINDVCRQNKYFIIFIFYEFNPIKYIMYEYGTFIILL